MLEDKNKKQVSKDGHVDRQMTRNALQCIWSIIITLMMKVGSTSETLVYFYQTTWLYNPDNSHLHTSLTQREIAEQCEISLGTRRLLS
jgi:hypothetical protein